MKILFFDFETTGLDPKKDIILEVGAVLWDWERKLPLRIHSAIIKDPNVEINLSEEQTRNAGGITNADIKEYGITPVAAFAPFYTMLNDCQYWCGHNAAYFDEPFFLEMARALNWRIPCRLLLDSLHDVEYPAHIKLRNLIYLAAMHGFINPFSHRAVTDALSTALLMSHYDIEKIILNASSPKIRVIANVPKPWEDAKVGVEHVKAQGFSFNGESKYWFKDIFERDILIEREKAHPYSLTVQEGSLKRREWWLRDESLKRLFAEGNDV